MGVGHVTDERPGNGSATSTEVSVTFPVLVTTYVYVTGVPAAVKFAMLACFTNPIAGACNATMTADACDVGFGSPLGGVPVAVAVFLTNPASTLACVVK